MSDDDVEQIMTRTQNEIRAGAEKMNEFASILDQMTEEMLQPSELGRLPSATMVEFWHEHTQVMQQSKLALEEAIAALAETTFRAQFLKEQAMRH